MGFEPMNTGFADQRVSHFAIGAHARCTIAQRGKVNPYFGCAVVRPLGFAVNCIESSTRIISSKLRPVVIGYASVSLIRLSGPITNTVRTGALFAGVRPSEVAPSSA